MQGLGAQCMLPCSTPPPVFLGQHVVDRLKHQAFHPLPVVSVHVDSVAELLMQCQLSTAAMALSCEQLSVGGLWWAVLCSVGCYLPLWLKIAHAEDGCRRVQQLQQA